MHLCMGHPLAAFDWSQARAFRATVEAGSLSKAARELRLTRPTLSRQVAGLEADLGVVLFERVGWALVPTGAGRDLEDRFRDMDAAAERIALAAAGRSQATEGRVATSASDACADFVLTPFLTELQAIAPGIEIEVLAANSVSDLQRREADLAIRHLRPSEPELIGRKVDGWRARLCAARTYLYRQRRPDVVAGLAGHDLTGFAPVERLVAPLVARGLPVTRRNLRQKRLRPISTSSWLVEGTGRRAKSRADCWLPVMQADHSGVDLSRVDELQRMRTVERRSQAPAVAQNHGMDVGAMFVDETGAHQ